VSIDLPAEPPDDAPDELALLWPLVLRWAESDDALRERLIDNAADEDLRALTRAVRPMLTSIDAYLDRAADAAHAVPFGDLAQAAIEAEQVLVRRA
jgi:hypothetical protein